MEEAIANLFLLSHSDDIESSVYYETHKEKINLYISERGLSKADMFHSEIGLDSRLIPKGTKLNKLPPNILKVLKDSAPKGDTIDVSILHSIAYGILEYYRMNDQIVIEINNTEFSVCKFYDTLGSLCGFDQALMKITACADLVIPSLKFSSKVTDVVIADGILLVPNNFKASFTESKIIRALAEVVTRIDFIANDSNSLYAILREAQSLLDAGEINKVFNPNARVYKVLRDQHIMYLNGSAPSLSSSFAKIGYTLPNLFMSYDKDVECSYYATHDNRSIVIVQWNELDFVGSVVVPLEIAREIYSSKTRLYFVAGRNVLIDYTEFHDIPIGTINSIPLFKMFEDRAYIDANPNVLKGLN